MRKLIIAIICSVLVLPALVSASEGGVPLIKADVDISNKASLRRGAKLFVNYCMGCHSLQYMSYGRLAKDLNLTKEDVFKNLMWAYTGKQNMGDYMKIAMPPEEAKNWFGTPPPDLSLVARSRSPDWLNTYLRSFYVDKSRPFGVNNTVFHNVGMPDILWQLEGMKKAKYEEVTNANGEKEQKFVGFETVTEGSVPPAQFDEDVRDLVNFLTYVGEPGRPAHERLGVWVILFLVIFTAIAYALKKEYWKDVH